MLKSLSGLLHNYIRDRPTPPPTPTPSPTPSSSLAVSLDVTASFHKI